MKHPESETDSVPEQQRSSSWWRIRRWLGLVGSTSQREGNDTVIDSQLGASRLNAPKGGSAEKQAAKRSDTDALFNRKLAERWKATEHEAGRPEGRVVPALVLGEQRYPDPSVWRPDIAEPLMQNEDYRKALAFISSLDDLPDRD
jgi:hypothetical protein